MDSVYACLPVMSVSLPCFHFTLLQETLLSISKPLQKNEQLAFDQYPILLTTSHGLKTRRHGGSIVRPSVGGERASETDRDSRYLQEKGRSGREGEN